MVPKSNTCWSFSQTELILQQKHESQLVGGGHASKRSICLKQAPKHQTEHLGGGGEGYLDLRNKTIKKRSPTFSPEILGITSSDEPFVG